jgi:hypothetical protein
MHAENAGATAVLIVQNTDEEPLRFDPGADGDGLKITIPVYWASRRHGEKLVEAIQSGSATQICLRRK